MAAVGGFRSGFDGAQDYDLVLRLTEEAARRGSPVGHIAKPLYSWRMIPGSTALDTAEKPDAHHAGHRALRDAMERRMEPATVQDGEYDTTHRIRYSVDTSQLLTIMIPTRDRVDLLARCVQRIDESTHAVRYQLLVVDNDSSDPATLAISTASRPAATRSFATHTSSPSPARSTSAHCTPGATCCWCSTTTPGPTTATGCCG